MAFAAVTGMPAIFPIGAAHRQGSPSIQALSTITIDAANEAAIMVGQIWWEDNGSHTVDTSGSSSIQWRASTVTFANAGTTFKVGIAAVDAATGPPTRAANSTDVITFDVAASFTGGGGGVTTAAWNTSVPTSGTKTIATGDLVAVCIQMTARAGVDSILVSVEAPVNTNLSIPSVTSYTGGSYAAASRLPNAVLVASDGTRGYFFGGYVANVGSQTQTWNSGSATKEYGNIIRAGFPTRAFGIQVGNDFAGNCDLILYSDPLGTPVAQRTVSVDLNTIGASSPTSDGRFLFSSAYDLSASTDYAIIAKPTSGTNVGMPYKTYNISAHQNSEPLGTDCYAISRASGAFAAVNSSKDRFAIGLLVGAFDSAVSTARRVQINDTSLVGS